jgi:hypothetical protein
MVWLPGYGLENNGIDVGFPTEARDFMFFEMA